MSQTPLEALKESGDHAWRIFDETDQPKCPHCGKSNDISDSGAYHLYEEGTHTLDCAYCNLEFKIETTVTIRFSSEEQEQEAING